MKNTRLNEKTGGYIIKRSNNEQHSHEKHSSHSSEETTEDMKGYSDHEKLDERGHGSKDHSDHDKHAGHSPEMFREKFWLSLIMTLPVVFWSVHIQILLG